MSTGRRAMKAPALRVAGTPGLRVAILDDAPYVSWNGRYHAVNATFHRFAAALLDVRTDDGRAAVEQVVLAAPVRPADAEPATLPVDPRIGVVPTLPFEGIAGYLRRAPVLALRNLPRLRQAFSGADVVVLRLPASNGLAAAALAVAMGRPRVAYVVGSVADVAAAQERSGAGGLAARLVGLAYDAATRLAGVGADHVVVGRDLGSGGIVSSLVDPDEIRATDGDPGAWPAMPGFVRLVFAGRLVAGKGIEDLLAATARLHTGAVPGDRPFDSTLTVMGDGPARPALEAEAARLGIAHKVTFTGHVAERPPYLDRLAGADLFVSASPAEGFPKVVLDAMAAGLPVVAVAAGSLEDVAASLTGDATPFLPVTAADPQGLAEVIHGLVIDPGRAVRLRAAGHAFARAHTMPAEAERLVAVLERAARR